jgi:DNA damage-inducible protein 1
MSLAVANSVEIAHLIDTRFKGTMKGVGSAASLGRITSSLVKFESVFVPCMFTVMEQSGMSVLIGLDFLRRYQCVIDLHRNVLVMTFENNQVLLPFLSEHEIPASGLFDTEGSPRPNGLSPTSSSSAAAVPACSPASAPALSTPPTAAAASAPTGSIPTPIEADVETLVQMGFDRGRAEEARRVLGSVGAAVDFLSK